MQIALIGLPNSGKTTIFNALTRGTADVASYGGSYSKPNIGIAKVRDPRLTKLVDIYIPERVVQAEVAYIDFPAQADNKGDSNNISGEYLNHLQGADILTIVSRTFEDPAVPHINETVDVVRDIVTMSDELLLVDLQILERRLEKLVEGHKGAKIDERDKLDRETSLLTRLKAELESGIPIREQAISQEEFKLIGGYKLLSAKPLVVVPNIGEDHLADLDKLESNLTNAMRNHSINIAMLCGTLEMELAQMDSCDEAEFRQSLGVIVSGLDRMVELAYKTSNKITFFTVGADEVKAWPLDRGTTAQKAAGKIHTDIERGFIRAEIVSYDDLIMCGTETEARRRGILRSQGKSYVISDGDVVNFLFNV